MQPMDAVLLQLPKLVLESSELGAIEVGRKLKDKSCSDQIGQLIRIYNHKEEFVALYRQQADRELHPEKVFLGIHN
jgi:tRNA U55 pseudouridine synthase TruB